MQAPSIVSALSPLTLQMQLIACRGHLAENPRVNAKLLTRQEQQPGQRRGEKSTILVPLRFEEGTRAALRRREEKPWEWLMQSLAEMLC